MMTKLIIVLLILFAGMLLITSIVAARVLGQPIDPPLALNPPKRSDEHIEALPPTRPELQGGQPLFCGNSGTMAIMVSGLSMPIYRDVHGIGALRLVKVDFSDQSGVILQVPRALYVDTSGMDLGVDETSLTKAYLLAREAAPSNNPKVINRMATQELAQVLVDNYGYLPDKYITVDPEPFVDLVDRLGGVDIHLDEAVDGTLEDMGYYPAGDVHLDGEEALSFVRIIDDANDPDDNLWDKFMRQMKVAMAICVATASPANWDQIPDLIRDARQLVVTDLSVDQAMDLACMAHEVGADVVYEQIEEAWVDIISDEEIRVLTGLELQIEARFQDSSSDK